MNNKIENIEIRQENKFDKVLKSLECHLDCATDCRMCFYNNPSNGDSSFCLMELQKDILDVLRTFKENN